VRVIVAGGRGFVGRATCARLADDGHDVRATGRDDTLAAVATGCDALVWAAGEKHADDARNHADHVAAPLAAIAASGGSPRVVYLSSGEIYGAQDVPFVEDAPRLGRSSYARAKIAAEDALLARGSTFVLRPSVIIGPRQTGPMFVPSIVAAAVAGRRIAMTRGEQTRDLVFVDDVAGAIARCLADRAPPPGVYNIGSGVEIRLVDLALQICDIADAPGQLLDIGSLPYRPDEQMRYVLDVTRAADRLGWRATTPLAEALARCIIAG
jgi:nucleoside-diphosphate-sugar epimerase